ncbi:HlyD family efflux transporter periplasmic adaptor subunit [Acaryochloris sp. CCMEE 5410]|uniref:HlyD family efflux transporter periplasmic adaptor subunit n=1 Tax=Acaryochloris sp. CCMEE 5410 TaxID=310037 RepID=UPI0002483D25|nr:HlyD family efflux transporter periplasmic adaptor subunit [Acaryochloris sp. CCMEE 5410]KAI9134308.1 HlyD family efflux transporter periplasmic adaptor subunit [Acaryochloris sp. CCMEE 5410]
MTVPGAKRQDGKWLIVILGSSLLMSACGLLQAQPTPTPTPIAVKSNRVVARGKIIPEFDVIKLSVSNAEDSRVNRILVKVGDRVRANQVIATLQGADRRLADLKAAQANVKLLQARLIKAKQGDAKPGGIAAQQAVVVRLETQLPVEIKQKEAEIVSAQASLREAALTYQRRQQLFKQGAISRAEVDTAREEFETTRATLATQIASLEQTVTTLKAQILEEKARLAELQQVRPIDVTIAQAELEQALIEVEQRRADYDDTQVRAPIPGQILRINTKVGEQVNTQLGIVDLGRTEQMFVQAEVYETDVSKVRKGQRAKILSEYGGFEGEIQGVVDDVGLQIDPRTLSTGNNNPTTDENARVVNVSIRIDKDDSPIVAGLTNMQVRVTIDLQEKAG